MVGAGGARIRLSAKFYLVAIFFVVFDLEALYLYAWATSVREVGWVGFTTAASLYFSLTCWFGLCRLSIGALNWAPADKRKAAGIKAKVGSPNMKMQKLRALTQLKSW